MFSSKLLAHVTVCRTGFTSVIIICWKLIPDRLIPRGPLFSAALPPTSLIFVATFHPVEGCVVVALSITIPLLCGAVIFYLDAMLDHPVIKPMYTFLKSVVKFTKALIGYTQPSNLNMPELTDMKVAKLEELSPEYTQALKNGKKALDEVDLQIEVIPKAIQATTDLCTQNLAEARVKLDECTATLDKIKLQGKDVKK